MLPNHSLQRQWLHHLWAECGRTGSDHPTCGDWSGTPNRFELRRGWGSDHLAGVSCSKDQLCDKEPPTSNSKGEGGSPMVINFGLYAACFLSLYVLNTTKPK